MKQYLKAISVLFVVVFTMSNAFAADVYLYVTRHGKTMFNTVHRAQGWSDTPLTQPGIEVAQQLGRGLKDVDFIATYSSDLGRARQTARIVLETKGVPVDIIEMDRLRETCFGLFEGDLDPNMWGPAAQHLGYKSDTELMADMAKGNIALPQMMNAIAAVETSGQAEDYEKVKTRMQEALTMIAKSAQEQGGGNVLIVSHGMAIMAMITEMTDTPLTGQLGNASVTKIRYTDEGKFIVESIGDMSYIEKGKQ
ncbi:histidine phosphatase family protein [Zophobihabitans entericus]|uniref:Histidine phosphatase family protein n=1 Tax=Zophobihabitans entericus TaxID=1635327 RepID=A0A6G9IBU6_9GAMM|nr:histidine phosphatase family protein [Zophobihabitans entericus]QIQ21683.1 histidine phosphatase family protein [Zophobihabitans entericus]